MSISMSVSIRLAIVSLGLAAFLPLFSTQWSAAADGLPAAPCQEADALCEGFIIGAGENHQFEHHINNERPDFCPQPGETVAALLQDGPVVADAVSTFAAQRTNGSAALRVEDYDLLLKIVFDRLAVLRPC